MDSAIALADLMAFCAQMLKRIYEAVSKYGTEYDARSLEAFVEEQVKAFGAVILETAWRKRMKGQAIPRSRPCACGRVKHYVDRRPCTVRGVVGEMELDERHYYRCDQCGATEFVGDELRGTSEFTALAEERIALMGKDGAYGGAANKLKRLGIIAVAGSTVRSVCLRLGRRLKAKWDGEAAQQYGTEGVKTEGNEECLAIGVDGTMLGKVDVQHRRRRSRKTGRKVRGKGALRHFFQEVKTLVVFSFNKRGEALRKTFYATQERVDAFREKIVLEAHRRGASTARRLVFLGDGAAWIWKTAGELFPKAIQVLDWYHAVEHLWAVGRARFGTDEKSLWAWMQEREKELWEGRVEEVLVAIRAASKALGAPDPKLSPEARERDARWIVFRNIGYFEENRGRMDYPRYRAENLPIGSGVIESSCKHVVGDRLKRSGMRWDDEGAEDLLMLRCEDLNGRWDRLWPLKTPA
jgi:hypothetical protein